MYYNPLKLMSSYEILRGKNEPIPDFNTRVANEIQTMQVKIEGFLLEKQIAIIWYYPSEKGDNI